MANRTNATTGSRVWRNSSVRLLAKDRDPIQVITAKSRQMALQAMEQGWQGPPFDPFVLARILGIEMEPTEAVADAQITPVGRHKFAIHYNPSRPVARTRYSVAHEIAHTLFPDCADTVRQRINKQSVGTDEWELEMLCNLAAAELLMPISSFPELSNQDFDIESLMKARSRHAVSAEALFLRVSRLTDRQCVVFAASRPEKTRSAESYRIDYAVPSRTWQTPLPKRATIPVDSAVKHCTAIGYTEKGDEAWPSLGGTHHVECVGIPAYPGRLLPRVLGIATPLRAPKLSSLPSNRPKYVRGDATEPRGDKPKIIAHIVNDRARSWGPGFAGQLKKKWPYLHEDFKQWVSSSKTNLVLGNNRLARLSPELDVCHMVGQKGYGHSPRTRIRYSALASCLNKLSQEALERDATVHMPRIGAGLGGGSWAIISGLIDEILCSKGITVTIYDLPGSTHPAESQQTKLL